MTLTIIVGDVGSGKTALMTHLIVQENRDIWSNYEVRVPRWRRLEPEMIVDLQDCIVAGDELWSWIEARCSGTSKANEYMSHMLFLSRKDGNDYYGTAQLFRSIDLRFREMADLIVQCEAHGDPRPTLRDGRPNPRYTPNGWFQYDCLKRSNKRNTERKFCITFQDAHENIFPLYDTYEKPFVNPDLVGAVVQNKVELLKRLQPYIDELLSSAPASKWSRSAVEGYCVHKALPKAWVSVIYAELRYRAMN